MQKIIYSIGPSPASRRTQKRPKLHLWRESESCVAAIATFSSYAAMKVFADEFNFPLADSICKELDEIKMEGAEA